MDIKEFLGHFLNECGTKVLVGNDTYYHIPYWFTVAEDGTFVKLKFDEIPPELRLDVDMIALGQGILLVGDDSRYFQKKDFAVGNNGMYNPKTGDAVLIDGKAVVFEKRKIEKTGYDPNRKA